MTDLLQAFDSYKDFNKAAYFTLCFDTLSSDLLAEISIERTKENMERIMEIIDPPSKKLEVVFKTWMTEDDKDSKLSSDFPFEYLLKSETNHLIVWVTLENNFLNVNFLYDVADKATEQWVLSTNHKLRSSLGENKAPTFQILSKTKDNFRTKEVKLEAFEFDVNRTYNDDFKEVNEIILNSLSKTKAGLILLHGKSGTGKTSYIKNLINTHPKKTFIFIQNEFVSELLDPEFISFLLKHKDAILIIEDAEKVIATRERANENSVVSTILQLTDGLFSDYLNVKIICTFNTSIEKIDKALLRKGRMIAYYDFQALTKEKANALLESQGAEPANQELTLAEIYNFQTKEFDQHPKKNKIGF